MRPSPSNTGSLVSPPTAAVDPSTTQTVRAFEDNRLASQLFGLTWGGLYMTLVARDWEARLMVAVFSLTIPVISFAYFYRRRALFRARWRWQWLERSWPRFIGPETLSPDARPGFSGLSALQRRLFVAAVAIGLVIEQLSAR